MSVRAVHSSPAAASTRLQTALTAAGKQLDAFIAKIDKNGNGTLVEAEMTRVLDAAAKRDTALQKKLAQFKFPEGVKPGTPAFKKAQAEYENWVNKASSDKDHFLALICLAATDMGDVDSVSVKKLQQAARKKMNELAGYSGVEPAMALPHAVWAASR